MPSGCSQASGAQVAWWLSHEAYGDMMTEKCHFQFSRVPEFPPFSFSGETNAGSSPLSRH